MTPYTIKNLKEIKESATERAPGIEGRFGGKHLGPEHLDISYFRYEPGIRAPMAHSHDEQEEAYIVINGSGRIKVRRRNPRCTQASVRAVPLQATALAALEQLPANRESALLFQSARGGHFDLHNFRNRDWKPAQHAAGITPLRRVYDLRHTFATFALRAGISTFDLSRYMGASLTMIDRHYGHLARDGRDHAIDLLDAFTGSDAVDVHAVDAACSSETSTVVHSDNGKTS